MSLSDREAHTLLRTELLARVDLVAKVPDMYRNLVMDTPEDQALHEQVTATADLAVGELRSFVEKLTPAADA